MKYVAASTFMTAFGESPELAPGHWNVALELSLIPHLSDAQRQVGFDGFKKENLNKSPVFGRLRLSLGLPAGWVAEFGYTPPLAIHGTRPRHFVALAVGHRLIERDAWTLSARIFGQHGAAQGDITCPAELAGISDPVLNPSGYVAASHDQIALNYCGIDVTAGLRLGTWNWHAGLGVVRTELGVQVDALVFDLHDRSRLVARDVLPYLAIGASHQVDTRWSLGAEVLYVPLMVRREFAGPRE
ncbi:MAG: hypothetical protein ACRD3W_17910 [Terriglobales bacterium]